MNIYNLYALPQFFTIIWLRTRITKANFGSPQWIPNMWLRGDEDLAPLCEPCNIFNPLEDLK